MCRCCSNWSRIAPRTWDGATVRAYSAQISGACREQLVSLEGLVLGWWTCSLRGTSLGRAGERAGARVRGPTRMLQRERV